MVFAPKLRWFDSRPTPCQPELPLPVLPANSGLSEVSASILVGGANNRFRSVVPIPPSPVRTVANRGRGVLGRTEARDKRSDPARTTTIVSRETFPKHRPPYSQSYVSRETIPSVVRPSPPNPKYKPVSPLLRTSPHARENSPADSCPSCRNLPRIRRTLVRRNLIVWRFAGP